MGEALFRGVATALVTPFSCGEVDYSAFDALIEKQISARVGALVIGGTTGEVSCLNSYERERLYSFAVEKIAGRVPVILGTGSNSTRTAEELTKLGAELGADGALAVTPYYNKGTEQGMLKHYLSLAECSRLPIIIYNVPSRTNVNISLDNLSILAEHENIVGIKEASDSSERLVSVCALSDKIAVYSGNDATAYSALSLGGSGVISVVSNLYPECVRDITDMYFSGRRDEALSLQMRLLPLIRAMFCEVNPVPIKYAMSLLSLCKDEVRLPLTPPTEASRRLIEKTVLRK
ncbi:MAG: 4-hydroxy-tetrahydrodipicolinate synthase [Clostridia bacterium]|nr:4-hydroxy-tetrahydrodipicolinate synthase [Clostridia bacterium]